MRVRSALGFGHSTLLGDCPQWVVQRPLVGGHTGASRFDARTDPLGNSGRTSTFWIDRRCIDGERVSSLDPSQAESLDPPHDGRICRIGSGGHKISTIRAKLNAQGPQPTVDAIVAYQDGRQLERLEQRVRKRGIGYRGLRKIDSARVQPIVQSAQAVAAMLKEDSAQFGVSR